MNNSRWVGLLGGTIVLLCTFLLFGSSVHADLYMMPAEAVNGVAFTLAFGLGLIAFLPTSQLSLRSLRYSTLATLLATAFIKSLGKNLNFKTIYLNPPNT
ncbi:hypothetical protein [Vibrio alginolyticus]|uniref:hypothetical protein n=1 Tax=Vibrio TaxID=662 RepID=UPI001CDD7B1B|nr:hypothetical protein [Vibrio alginolyticus]